MITLFASIAGFITSIIPEFIKFFKDVNDKKHEINILEKQIEFSKNSSQVKLEEIHTAYEAVENASLYSTYKSGIEWVDALNGTVRPVLAYCFFLMYVTLKMLQYSYISHNSVLIEYLDILWNKDDQAIFAGIISFYFGQRTFNKKRKLKL